MANLVNRQSTDTQLNERARLRAGGGFNPGVPGSPPTQIPSQAPHPTASDMGELGALFSLLSPGGGGGAPLAFATMSPRRRGLKDVSPELTQLVGLLRMLQSEFQSGSA
ncbi:hypothetical protein LCGC14_0919960 [marine sediment metagenome]|uniref:Uncharacterized protein n=1 Tax=marine sediment metagenome TaxID=412755 RepID=A0A0F9R9V8_9ZZZZ